MDILSLFVVVPVLTIVVLLFSKSLQQSRVISAIGMGVQFLMSLHLVYAYFKERQVNDDIMVFTKDVSWFETFNIHYAIGADGITVAMIVLASIVVLAGVFISWRMDDLHKLSLFVLLICVLCFCVEVLRLLCPFARICRALPSVRIGVTDKGRVHRPWAFH